jgi:hypothetical protein
MVDCRI